MSFGSGIDYFFNANAFYPYIPPNVSKAVHIIRNPLDILVSAYYSHRYSHPTEGWPDLSEHRRVLAGLDKTAGLALEFAYMFAHNFQFSENKPGVVPPFAAYERWDWDDPRILTVRMEDLTQIPDIVFARMFEHCGKVLPPHFDEAIASAPFEIMSGGRQKGQRDDQSHYRSGLSGEWRAELPDFLVQAVCQKFSTMMQRYYSDSL